MMRSGLRSVLAFVGLVARRFAFVRGAQVAGSLAFTTLLSLVPLLAVALVLITKFQLFSSLGEELRHFLLANLLPEKAGRMIATYAVQFSQKAARLTIVGGLFLFVTALMMIATIDRAFNRIWSDAPHRFGPRRLLTYAAVLIVGPVALGASLVATTYLVTASLGVVNEPPWVTKLFYRTLPVVFLAVLFAFLYYAVPSRRVDWRHAAAGGAFAALAFVLMQRLFGFYVAQFPTYALIYGAFATVPIFLLWLYLSWTVVLLGALVTALLPEHLGGVRVTRDYPGRSCHAALMILGTLARSGTTAGRSVVDLAAAACIAVDETETLLAQMRLAGWVVPIDDDRWLATRALSAISLSEVFERFAFDPRAWPEARNAAQHRLRRRMIELGACSTQALQVPLGAILEERDELAAP